MDPAVELITIYLQLNGYFVQTELPVLQRVSRNPLRYEQMTDVDVLAVRFPARGHVDLQKGLEHWVGIVPPDPLLAVRKDEIDLIVGEVKEGPSRMNRNLLDPDVLRCILWHAGGVIPEGMDALVEELLEHGEVRTPGKVRIRLTVFGRTRPQPRSGHPYQVVPHEHTIGFIWETLRQHRELFHVMQAKHPSLVLLRMVERSYLSER